MIESILRLLQGISSLVRNSDYVTDANLPILLNVVHFKRFMNNLEIFEDTVELCFRQHKRNFKDFLSRNNHILCGKSHAFYYVSYFTQKRFTCNAFICSKNLLPNIFHFMSNICARFNTQFHPNSSPSDRSFILSLRSNAIVNPWWLLLATLFLQQTCFL